MSRRPTAKARGNGALTVVFAALAVLFALLGDWQLDRAAQNRLVERRYEAASEVEPLSVPPDALEERSPYRRLRVSGDYVTGTNILLDNRTHAGRVGYEVLTPFRADGAGRWLLVNRGWVPAPPDRRRVPEVALESTPRTVEGRIAAFPAPGLRLAEPRVEVMGGGTLRLSRPAPEVLEPVLDARLLPYQLLLSPEAPNGFVREWRPRTVSAERNLAYAGQWFLFAAGAAGLASFFAWRIFRFGAGRSS